MHYFVVHSKNPVESCVFCVMAVDLLKKHGRPFLVKKLGEDFTREALLQEFPDAKTFPVITQVFDDGEGITRTYYIGGYTELEAKLNG